MTGEQNEKRRTEDLSAEYRRAFRAELASIAGERRRALTRGTIAVMLSTALGLYVLLVTAGRIAAGWRFYPLAAFIVFWSGVAVALVLLAVRSIFPITDERTLAGRLGALAGEGTFFGAALEFSRGGERLDAYSPFLMSETVRRAVDGLRLLRGEQPFALTGRPGWTLAGLLIGIVALFATLFMPAASSLVLEAVSDPGVSFRMPQGFNIRVVSGDPSVLAGEDFTAEAVQLGSLEGAVTLRVSAIPGVWKSIPLETDTTGAGEAPLTLFRHTFNAVQEDFRYYFEAGEEQTGRHSVTVMRRPVINILSAVLEFPAYTEARPETIATLAGRIAGVRGTRVVLRGEASTGIREGSIVFNRREAIPLERSGERFRASFRISGDDTFMIEIADSSGLVNEALIRYPVVAVEDRPPFIELLAPRDNDLLPRSQVTSVHYTAGDDYGLSRVRLRYLAGSAASFDSLELPLGQDGPVRETDGIYTWSLEGMRIFPGDKISYFLEAYDNSPVPGYARTETRRLLVPSLAEIYAAIQDQERGQEETLEEVLEEGRELSKRLRDLSEDFKSEREFDWSRRREGREILEKHRELQEKIGSAADEIDRTLSDLERNRMTSQEVGEKLEEIQRLLERIESEELRRAIEKLQELLGGFPEEEIADTLEELEMSTEDLVNRLDRTIELLQQVVREEQMEALLRRMEDMLDEQMALRDSTAAGETDELSRQQRELGDEYEQFEQDWNEFASSEQDSTGASAFSGLCRQMNEEQIAELMRRAAGEIEAGERDQARCTQQSTIDGMLSLYTKLGQCQMSMGLALDREVIERMNRTVRELIEVSKLQEALVPRLGGDVAGTEKDALITDQLVLKEAVRAIAEELHQIARRTMMVSGEVFLHLGGALGGTEAVLVGIEQEKYGEARTAAGITYQQLNRTVIELLHAMSSAGGSSGSARERMQMMLQQQLSIDQQLRRLLEQRRMGQWSMEERAAMQRIAAEQRKMRELMGQIAEESAGTQELLGRLDDLADEMSAVAEELDRGTLDGDLLEREERILSRMLESQRSMQRRDYKRERVSRTAGDIPADEVEDFEGELDDEEVLLDMIRRAMQEKGPAEYEALIRQYFRALSKKAREGR